MDLEAIELRLRNAYWPSGLTMRQSSDITDLLAEVHRLRQLIAGLLGYREHSPGCEIGSTDFCTCGMKQVADAARAALSGGGDK